MTNIVDKIIARLYPVRSTEEIRAEVVASHDAIGQQVRRNIEAHPFVAPVVLSNDRDLR